MTAGVAPTAGSNSEPRKYMMLHESSDINNEDSSNHPYYAQEASLQEKIYQVIAQGKMQPQPRQSLGGTASNVNNANQLPG
jgi:hypothetical protein